MLADRFDAFLLDLDGVLTLGGRPLPGAAEALDRLRRMGKTLRVLTNDPRPEREALWRRLDAVGLPVAVDEIVSVGWATARWLASRFPGGTLAWVVGSEGLRREIERAGLTVGTAGSPRVVVVGCDERVTYEDIARAARGIRAGALFVATNRDATFPTPDGPAPATGAIVKAVEVAAGRTPLVIGKPAGAMFALARASIPAAARIAMVGDSLETDIAGARAAGLGAIWVRPEGAAAGTAGASDPAGPPSGTGMLPGEAAAGRLPAAGEAARAEPAGPEASRAEASRGQASRGERARGDAPRGDASRGQVTGPAAAGAGAAPVHVPVPAPDYVVASIEALLHDVEPYRPEAGGARPDRVEAGVAAVVLDAGGRVLLGLRADNGMWGLPSGHVEPGESVEEAVVREVREETGLRVRVERLIGVYSDPASQTFAYPDGRVVQFVTSTCLCRPAGGALAADGRETLDVRFFPLDALPTPLLPMHPRWLDDAIRGGQGLIR